MHCLSLLFDWARNSGEGHQKSINLFIWFLLRSLFFDISFCVKFLIFFFFFSFASCFLSQQEGVLFVWNLLMFVWVSLIQKNNWQEKFCFELIIIHIQTIKRHLHDWFCILEGISKSFSTTSDLIEEIRLRTFLISAC